MRDRRPERDRVIQEVEVNLLLLRLALVREKC
jgi:hypothetical protein